MNFPVNICTKCSLFILVVVQEARLNVRCEARGSGPRAARELAAAMAQQAAEAAAAPGDGAAAAGTEGEVVGWSCLSLPLVLQPCTLPAGLRLWYRGQVRVGYGWAPWVVWSLL